MKFTIQSKIFKKYIYIASRICGINLTLPVLNNILLELKNNNLQIFSTNLEIGILINIPIEVEEEGKISIPGKILSDFLNSLPNQEVKIKTNDFIVNLKCGDYNVKILGQDPKDFPVLPQIEEKSISQFKSQEIISGFSKVSHIVSPFDTRTEISGILINFKKDKLLLCGTDSIRLAEKTIRIKSVNKDISAIIPQKTTTEIINIFSGLEGNMEIIIDKSQISFNFIPKDKKEPSINLISRLIDGNFPNYKEIIPKKIKTECIFNKEELYNKIKIAGLFSSKIQDVKIKFEPKNNKILIFSSSSNIGEAHSQLNGQVNGDEMEITFNWKYLLDGLSVIDSSEVFLGVNDSTSPIIIQPIGDKTYLYILMPKTV